MPRRSWKAYLVPPAVITGNESREVRHDLRALAPAAPREADETVVGGAERRHRPGPGHEASDRSSLRWPGAATTRRPPRWPAPEGWTANQTWFSETASPFGRFAIGIRSTTRSSAGSMRAIACENSLAHPDGSGSDRDAVGTLADGDRRRDAVRARVDARDGAVERVRDPHGAVAERDRRSARCPRSPVARPCPAENRCGRRSGSTRP